MKKTQNLVIQVKYSIGDKVKVAPYEGNRIFETQIVGIDVEWRVGKLDVYYVVNENGRELAVIESEIMC